MAKRIQFNIRFDVYDDGAEVLAMLKKRAKLAGKSLSEFMILKSMDLLPATTARQAPQYRVVQPQRPTMGTTLEIAPAPRPARPPLPDEDGIDMEPLVSKTLDDAMPSGRPASSD